MLCRLEIIINFAPHINCLIMEKKTYKDLKDGDTVYVVDGANGFEELTVKIREEQHPLMIYEEDEEKEIEELNYVLDLFYKDGTKYKYNWWEQSVAKFKDAVNTHDYESWDDLWGLECFFNRDDAVDYYKKTVKNLVDVLDKKIDNLEQQRSKYVEVLNSFE